MPSASRNCRRADGAPLALAGLWEGWRASGPTGEIERTFAIITMDANALMAPIHKRMPVVIEPADWPVWLGEAEGDAAALLHPTGEDVLRLGLSACGSTNRGTTMRA